MKQVIAMHGWCSDSTLWEKWEQYFNLEGWLWKSADRGYGSLNSKMPDWESGIKTNPGHSHVVICHSLGIHLISSRILKEASHIILINCFSRFIPDGKEKRSIHVALEGMRQLIGKRTEQNMINKFYVKANAPYKDNLIVQEPLKEGISLKGRKQLKSDLEILINSNKLPSELNPKAQVLVINGDQDQIISACTRLILMKDLKDYLEKPPLHWKIKDEGHFIHPSKLITRVQTWLKKA